MSTDKKVSKNSGPKGFSLVQLLIVVATVAIVASLGTIGIVRARAHMRLTNSARQFAGYLEKARADSVRRHAAGTDRSSVQLADANSYSVTMDFDRNGVIDGSDTKTYTLESGVVFTSAVPTTITFDWRGRSVTGEVTPVMALGTDAGAPSVLITVTGSGDVTLDAEIFQDAAIPNINHNGNVSGDIRPDPPPNPGSTPTPGASATPTPTPNPNASPTPTPDPNASPTPTPCGNNGINCQPTPDPNASPTPCGNMGINCRPSPSPSPTPTPTPTPTPAPTPNPCTLTAYPTSLSIGNHVTQSVTLTVAGSPGVTTVLMTNNTNATHISVTLAPGQTGIVTGGSGTVTYNILVNGTGQSGTITFSASAPCGATRTVRVN